MILLINVTAAATVSLDRLDARIKACGLGLGGQTFLVLVSPPNN
jgi:hypothetical protein